MQKATKSVKPNVFSRFWTSLLRNDSFGQSFHMKLKDGMDAHPTVSGLICSILRVLAAISI